MVNGAKAKNILLVEDETIIAMSEVISLRKYGFNALTVSSGQQAIQALETCPEIDLVLMDIDLGWGEMDGTQAAEIILQQHDLPLIFLSGHTEREVVEKTEGITSYGYIVKNSGETVLIASIKMAFRLFEARRLERQKDAALRESEERFRLSMEAAQEGLWDSDFVTGVTYYSPAYWKILGYEAGDALPEAQDWYSLVHPEDREAVWQANQACYENQVEAFEIQFRMRARDGGWRWVQSRGKAASRTEDGRARRILGTHTDITARKQAEQALGNSEQKFAAAFQHAPVFMAITTVDEGRLVSINDAFVRFMGFSRQEALGKTTLELGVLLPADRARVIQALQEHGRVEAMECTVYTRDKRPIPVSFNGEVILVDGQPHMLSIVLDMTAHRQAEQALRQSEARYRELVEAAPDAILLTQPYGRILVCSAETARLHGYASPGELVGRPASDLFAPQELPRLRQNLALALQHGASRNVAYRMRRADGSEFIGELSLATVANLDGQPASLVGITRDITQHKLAEEALRASEEKFYKAFHALPVAMGLSSLDEGRYLDVNEEFARLFGWSREQAAGRTASELNLWVHPEQREVILAHLQANGALRGLEMEVRAKSGQVKSVLWSAELVSIDNQPYLLAAALDITERKRIEHSLETALREKRRLLQQLQQRAGNKGNRSRQFP